MHPAEVTCPTDQGTRAYHGSVIGLVVAGQQVPEVPAAQVVAAVKVQAPIHRRHGPNPLETMARLEKPRVTMVMETMVCCHIWK